jgi:hypothetical protein
MIGLNIWPQLSTAAAFVTAIAVVLNPITPVLPDVTVPALFPPATAHRLPAEHHAAATTPAPAVPATAGPEVLPVPNTPSPPPSLPIQPTAPVSVPAALAQVAPSEPAQLIDIDMAPTESAPTLPVVQTQQPPIGMAHAGDRPRVQARRQPFATPAGGPRPLPAAAGDSPDAAGPGAGGVTRQHGRGGAERPDAGGPASRGHRGPADGN